jgi:predicted DsbA family dithiol-disulfide isomerase
MVQIEIWSDLLCPFCYIGKRQLEAALRQFEHSEHVKITWKSFQLDPAAERNPNFNTYERLARKYGNTVEWAKQMTSQIAERAASLGLKFDYDRTIPTNSMDAHRLIHLAAKHGLQDQAEERLFAAYFSEGQHIGDPQILKQLGVEIGLDADEVEATLASDEFAKEVRSETREAQSMGIAGVPFFLMNRKLAVGGAHPVETFLGALRQAWAQQ